MIYNVVIASANKIGGANSASYDYYYDWSLMPDGQYEMTFSFMSNTFVGNLGPLIIGISGLGINKSSFITGSSTSPFSIASPNFIGYAKNLYNGLFSATTQNSFHAATVDNPPVYIFNRPFGSSFTVSLTDFSTLAARNDLTNYVLTLSFKKVQD